MEALSVIVVLIIIGIILMIRRILELTTPDSLQVDSITRKMNNYQAALAALRKDPTNPSLHEQALTLGRIYSAATRENKRITLFDETALANDIRAVTANATQTAPVVHQTKTSTPAQSIDERISALKKMRENDLLTDEEFEQKRKDILNSI